MQTFATLAFDVRLNTKPTYWHCERGWEWRAQPLPDHVLWYVMDGVGTMQIDDRVWELNAGSCFVFRPGSRPHGKQDPDRRLVVFGMHFDVLNPHGEPVQETAEMLPPYGHVVRDTTFFALLAQRCDAAFRRGDEVSVLQCPLYLRAMILQMWEEALHPPPSAVDLALDEIMRAIQMEPGKRWTVDELAQRAHLSRAQLVRRFRELTGLSPARFIIQARIDRARQLIQETNMSLGQIARALGYDDVYFFSRQYKQHAGHPPSMLRRR